MAPCAELAGLQCYQVLWIEPVAISCLYICGTTRGI